MPLHLLGKKSWNVYNKDNIERVQRDEERARAAEQDAERRGQDQDAADRLRLLRGETSHSEEPATLNQTTTSIQRKRASQDEVGQQNYSIQGQQSTSSKRRRSDEFSSASGRERSSHGDKLNKSEDPLDQISNMRFRDAAGRGASSQKPWYSTLSTGDADAPVGRDVWGNEDARRQERDQKRLDASDPLLAMKRGVKQLRETEKQKAEWRQERERDLHEVEELARKASKHRHKHRHKRERDKLLDGRRTKDRIRRQHRSRSPER